MLLFYLFKLFFLSTENDPSIYLQPLTKKITDYLLLKFFNYINSYFLKIGISFVFSWNGLPFQINKNLVFKKVVYLRKVNGFNSYVCEGIRTNSAYRLDYISCRIQCKQETPWIHIWQGREHTSISSGTWRGRHPGFI